MEPHYFYSTLTCFLIKQGARVLRPLLESFGWWLSRGVVFQPLMHVRRRDGNLKMRWSKCTSPWASAPACKRIVGCVGWRGPSISQLEQICGWLGGLGTLVAHSSSLPCLWGTEKQGNASSVGGSLLLSVLKQREEGDGILVVKADLGARRSSEISWLQI